MLQTPIRRLLCIFAEVIQSPLNNALNQRHKSRVMYPPSTGYPKADAPHNQEGVDEPSRYRPAPSSAGN